MGGLFYFHNCFLSRRIKANRWALIVLLMAAYAVMLLGDAVDAGKPSRFPECDGYFASA